MHPKPMPRISALLVASAMSAALWAETIPAANPVADAATDAPSSCGNPAHKWIPLHLARAFEEKVSNWSLSLSSIRIPSKAATASHEAAFGRVSKTQARAAADPSVEDLLCQVRSSE